MIASQGPFTGLLSK